jgi:hypothetical protein
MHRLFRIDAGMHRNVGASLTLTKAARMVRSLTAAADFCDADRFARRKSHKNAYQLWIT